MFNMCKNLIQERQTLTSPRMYWFGRTEKSPLALPQLGVKPTAGGYTGLPALATVNPVIAYLESFRAVESGAGYRAHHGMKLQQSGQQRHVLELNKQRVQNMVTYFTTSVHGMRMILPQRRFEKWREEKKFKIRKQLMNNTNKWWFL